MKVGLTVLIGAASLLLVQTLTLDGIDGWLLATVLGEDTIYAQGYSDSAFRAVRRGDTSAEVTAALGPPLFELWRYEGSDGSALHIQMKDGKVAAAPESTARAGVRVDDSPSRVLEVMGHPTVMTFVYSKSAADGNYRVRSLIIEAGRITQKVSSFYLD